MTCISPSCRSKGSIFSSLHPGGFENCHLRQVREDHANLIRQPFRLLWLSGMLPVSGPALKAKRDTLMSVSLIGDVFGIRPARSDLGDGQSCQLGVMAKKADC